MQAQVSLRRLCRYLSCPETDSNWTSRVFGATDEVDFSNSNSDDSNADTRIYFSDRGQRPHVNVHGQAIMVKDAAFTWSNESDVVDLYLSVCFSFGMIYDELFFSGSY